MAPRCLPLVVVFLLALPALTATSNPRSLDEPPPRGGHEAAGGDESCRVLSHERSVAAKPDEVRRLIQQLGDDSFEVRQEASRQLGDIRGSRRAAPCVPPAIIPILKSAVPLPTACAASRSNRLHPIAVVARAASHNKSRTLLPRRCSHISPLSAMSMSGKNCRMRWWW